PDRIAERLSDLAHADFQYGVTHGNPRPDGLEERLLREELTRTFGETPQNGKGLRREPDGLGSPPEACVGHIQPVGRKAQVRGGFYLSYHRLTKLLPRPYDASTSPREPRCRKHNAHELTRRARRA